MNLWFLCSALFFIIIMPTFTDTFAVLFLEPFGSATHSHHRHLQWKYIYIYIKQNHQIKLVASWVLKIKFNFYDSDTHSSQYWKIYIFTHKLCNGVCDYDIIDVRRRHMKTKNKNLYSSYLFFGKHYCSERKEKRNENNLGIPSTNLLVTFKKFVHDFILGLFCLFYVLVMEFAFVILISNLLDIFHH